MTNELLDAAKSGEEDSSEERYSKLKKEEADIEGKSPAAQRFEELKEKAKREFERQEMKKKQQKEDADEESEDESEQFITY